MAAKPLPDAETLRQLLEYDPETGKLTWKPRAREFFVSDKGFKCWNGKHAGKDAFTAEDNYGYKQGNLLGGHYKAHRIAWVLHYGRQPSGYIDHINHDVSDNRIANLRDIKKRDNHLNMRTRGRPFGVKQVDSGHWQAVIMVNYRTLYLGTFDSRDAALSARKQAEAEHGFHENHGT